MAYVNIPDSVLLAIRRHAEQVRFGREVVGLIAVKGEEAVRYIRLRNSYRGEGAFHLKHRHYKGKLKPGEKGILCHSHPWSFPEPSIGDREKAHHRWLEREYAIYGLDERLLGLHILHSDRESFTTIGYYPVPS